MFNQYIVYAGCLLVLQCRSALVTSEESSSLIRDNLGHLGFVGLSLQPLTSNWCATWLAVTRQGGIEAVGSLEIFLIVCHALRLLPGRSVDVIILCNNSSVTNGIYIIYTYNNIVNESLEKLIMVIDSN